MEGRPSRHLRIRRLADLDMELWFDFYGPFEDDDE